jgi:thiol-disulfide isomerase/thioredoxin
MVKKNAPVAGPPAVLAAAPVTLGLALALAVVLASGLAAPRHAAAADPAPPLEGAFGENFTLLNPPVPAPQEAFTDLAQDPVRLADFEGRVVLLNFWATWCAPCVREMPSLERLQAALGDRGLSVVAVSIDRGGVAVIGLFAKRLGLVELALYHDPKGALFRAFGVTGLPASFVIDRGGAIVGSYAGPAEWDDAEARALIEYYLRQPEHAAAPGPAGG